MSDQPREPRESHDEQGLDLAREIAGQVRKSGFVPRRKGGKGPKPPTPTSSGPRPDDRDPQMLSDVVAGLVKGQQWETDLRVHGLFARWRELVGDGVGTHSQPESFADGKLVVRTDSTAWATQLRLLAGSIVRRLNEELGDGTVSIIEVLGPHSPTWKKGRLSVPGRGPRDTYG